MMLFASGLRKLARRQASWVTLGVLAGLLALIVIAVGATSNRPGASEAERAQILSLVTFPGAYDQIASFILGLGGLFAVIFGAAIAGSEWTWGTLKNAVARGQSRSRYVLLTFASVAAAIAIGLVVTFAVGVVAAVIGASLAGVSTSGLTDADALGRLPGLFARGSVAIVEEGALGFAIATLARSQLAGIGAGIGLYFGETFAAIFLPDVVKYLPFNVATASVSTGASAGGGFGGGDRPPSPRSTRTRRSSSSSHGWSVRSWLPRCSRSGPRSPADRGRRAASGSSACQATASEGLCGADVEALFERVRKAIAGRPIATGAGDVPITISVGVATLREADTESQLVTRADAALYRAKREGRDRVCVADDHEA